VSSVCPQCARRAWLLAKLNVRLDFKTRDLARLWALLALPDAELIEAIGGRRRVELHAAYAAWEPSPAQEQADWDVQMICRHHMAYPATLREHALAPSTLAVRGGLERFTGLLQEEVVAIVGTRRASDYGMETARSLARELAACGLTVASGLAEGIPSAVHSGALEAKGATLTVMANGVDRCSPAWCRPLYRRVIDSGCSISEIQDPGPHPPSNLRPHGWWQAARIRTLALIAELVIVVEAGEHPWEMACSHVATTHRKAVAAVPGRVSSPASMGTNSLLMSGARLVRNTQDALDVLYGVGARAASNSGGESAALAPRLAKMLARVGCGEDTMAKLTTTGSDSDEIAVALAELEMQGLLVRGDGGRYVPSTDPPAP
jgi:DNA processing protein